MDWAEFRGKTVSNGVDRAEVEAFLIYEARLLDERRFEDWMALFADDGYYWVPSKPDQADPHNHASLFYDDRELMKTRIDRLNHPRMHAQTPPSRTAHMVANVTVEEVDEATGEYLIGSTFNMVEYRQNRQRLFAGRYLHRLRRDGDGFRIAWKKVELINCDDLFEILAVPI
jgi:3-phenylpropionate/cinnamic acid dioxygenase small subunit